MIRVLVAEDHTIVREGIKQLIGLAKDMQVAGRQLTASNCWKPCAIRRARWYCWISRCLA